MNTTTFDLTCACGHSVTFDTSADAETKRAVNIAHESHLEKCPAEARRREDMHLIHDYAGPGGTKRDSLTPKMRRLVDRTIWSMQDGYGSAGYMPSQGWDWSRIRDSRPETVEQMAREVRRIVGIAA